MPEPQQRGVHGGADGALDRDPLVISARQMAERFLGETAGRWRHTQGVAATAAAIAGSVPAGDRPTLVAAAWLHDIGYAAALRSTGFHPLDGARYLLYREYPFAVAGLVAHHSCSRFTAAARGLARPLRAFDERRYATGPVADALCTADQTTGPDGRPMAVEDRLADMLARHGPDSPSARAHPLRAPAIRAAVDRTLLRLSCAGESGGDGGDPLGLRRPARGLPVSSGRVGAH